MFQKSFVRFKNGYVVTFDTLIVENVYLNLQRLKTITLTITLTITGCRSNNTTRF